MDNIEYEDASCSLNPNHPRKPLLIIYAKIPSLTTGLLFLKAGLGDVLIIYLCSFLDFIFLFWRPAGPCRWL